MCTHVVAIVLQAIHGTSFAKKPPEICKTSKPSTFLFQILKHHLWPCVASHGAHMCQFSAHLLNVWHGFARFNHFWLSCNTPYTSFLVLVNTFVNHLQKPMFDILYGI